MSKSEKKRKKLNKLYKEISKLPPEDWPSHLFVVTENLMMLSYGDGIIISRNFSPQIQIKSIRISSKNVRGEVLEAFAKIELLINSMIIKEIKPKDEENLVELLDRINFAGKIHLLKDWGVIDNKLKNKLFETKKLRDQFAHVWVKGGMRYKNKRIKNADQFNEFKEDLSFVWQELIRLNDASIQEIDSIIEEINDKTKL